MGSRMKSLRKRAALNEGVTRRDMKARRRVSRLDQRREAFHRYLDVLQMFGGDGDIPTQADLNAERGGGSDG